MADDIVARAATEIRRNLMQLHTRDNPDGALDALMAEIERLRGELERCNHAGEAVVYAAEGKPIPYGLDEHGMVRRVKAVREQVEQRLNILVDQLVRLFNWSDTSYLHATMHVENAVRNLRADCAAERQRADTAERELAEARAALDALSIVHTPHPLAQRIQDAGVQLLERGRLEGQRQAEREPRAAKRMP